MHDVNSLRPQELQVNIDSRIRRSISVLKDLASDPGAQRGRKSLVWVTHGIPITAINPVEGMGRDYTNLIRDLGNDLARAGIMLYAVDQSHRANMGLSSVGTLEELVRRTGGVRLSSDEVAKAIRQAVSDGAASYRVGYTPPLERWDNKFHKLRVALNKKSVSKVRLVVRNVFRRSWLSYHSSGGLVAGLKLPDEALMYHRAGPGNGRCQCRSA